MWGSLLLYMVYCSTEKKKAMLIPGHCQIAWKHTGSLQHQFQCVWVWGHWFSTLHVISDLNPATLYISRLLFGAVSAAITNSPAFANACTHLQCAHCETVCAVASLATGGQERSPCCTEGNQNKHSLLLARVFGWYLSMSSSRVKRWTQNGSLGATCFLARFYFLVLASQSYWLALSAQFLITGDISVQRCRQAKGL